MQLKYILSYLLVGITEILLIGNVMVRIIFKKNNLIVQTAYC